MIKKIKKSDIAGEIVIPSSKSHFQRLIAGALLAKEQSEIFYNSINDDTSSAINLIKNLGAEVETTSNTIKIKGGFKDSAINLNVGESGLGLRMFTPIVALQNRIFKISGKGSLLSRPVDFIVEIMKKFHVHIDSDEGRLPLYINGPLEANYTEIDGDLSSQLLTGLLMALPVLKEDSRITVNNLKSIPYINLTIKTLKKFNIEIKHDDYKVFHIAGKQEYKPVKENVEGDWSSASFIFTAAAIAGNVSVSGLDLNSTQGDKNILDVIKQCGADVEIDKDEITVKKNELNAFEYDATHTPDLFPPLVALAVNCKGISKIHGVKRLFNKESDRASTLKSEFEKLGATIAIKDNTMMVEAGNLKGAKVLSHNDHRIAMALAVAGITASEETVIEQSECVSKSWPTFFNKFASLGANIY